MEDQERALSGIIGQKIKHRRRAIRLTQKDLGHHLGITFQQLQKIERGINRISAARLMLLAPSLQVGMDYFWESVAYPAGSWPFPSFPYGLKATSSA
jgi:transcriptional regulator with XRE-family HTH domain